MQTFKVFHHFSSKDSPTVHFVQADKEPSQETVVSKLELDFKPEDGDKISLVKVEVTQIGDPTVSYQQQDFLNGDGQAMADVFSSFMNTMNTDDKRVCAEALSRQHPTLQQNTMRFFTVFVEAMASKTYSDLRNEGSVKLAKEIVKMDWCLRFV